MGHGSSVARTEEHQFTEWDESGENGTTGAGGAHPLAKKTIKLVR